MKHQISIPALGGPAGGLVVAHAEKSSILVSQFDSKQCREQLSVIYLVYLSLGAILWPSELLTSCVCFSILIRMMVLIPLVRFVYF